MNYKDRYKDDRPKSGSKKPNFIIIGAAKAATTRIAITINEHPEIFIPREESHYFSWYYNTFTPLSNAYLSRFDAAGDSTAIGENSNTYLIDPGAAARISNTLNDVKIILCVRNPIERAYSDYSMHYRLGRVNSSVENYLSPASSNWPAFIETGLYMRHLKMWLKYFPKENIHTCVFDDLANDPYKLQGDLYRFLGVDVAFRGLSLNTPFNTATQGDLPRTLRHAINSTSVGRVFASWAKHLSVNGIIRKALSRKFIYPKLPQAVANALRDYYARDVDELSNFLARDLSQWLAPHNSTDVL